MFSLRSPGRIYWLVSGLVRTLCRAGLVPSEHHIARRTFRPRHYDRKPDMKSSLRRVNLTQAYRPQLVGRAVKPILKIHSGLQKIRGTGNILALKSIATFVAVESKFVSTLVGQIFHIAYELGESHDHLSFLIICR